MILWKCAEHGIHGNFGIARYKNGIGVYCNRGGKSHNGKQIWECKANAFIPFPELDKLLIIGRTVTVVISPEGTYESELGG